VSRLSDWTHHLAHRLDDTTLCVCRVRAFQAGIQARRDAELKERELPSSPDALDAAFRQLIADSERYEGAA
jgi:hypothetical protein